MKDSNGKYFVGSENLYWHDKQSEAHRFETRDAAENISNFLNGHFAKSRIIKLKSYSSSKVKPLPHPKSGTVFLDLTMPEPTPNIVVCVYEERAKDFGEDGADNFWVCTVNSFSTRDQNIWGELEEYHEHLAKGKIKVLWEPDER